MRVSPHDLNRPTTHRRRGAGTTLGVSLTILPSIDLRDGKVVRLQQGDFTRQIDYDLDPIETARGFAAGGATMIHVVDLDGARAGQVMQAELIGQIARASGLTVQAGGGVRADADVRRLIDVGVDRVVIGTRAFENWAWFEMAARAPFAGRLVLAIDAKDGRITTHGWTRTLERTAVDVAQQVSTWPLAALLYTDVAKDGMLGGANVEMTARVAAATHVPVIASGGVGTLDHVRALVGKQIWGVILGRSLHDGRIALADAIHAARSV